MSAILLYLLKLSISLSIIWIFYQLMLRRLTFYNLNRWYLLGYSLLSFFIPLINIGTLLKKETFQGEVIRYIPVIGSYKKEVVPETGYFSMVSLLNILPWILLAGSAVLLIRLVSRWLSLRRVRQQARLISDAGVRIFQVDESIIPFSFGNAIYINQQLHTEKEYSAIILHEYVHIRQRHTADILLGELLCIISWYNPFAWLIRYSIRQNLEFIADRKVLENGVDKKGYQYHLLQVIGSPRYRLANNFNFSSLKKRIIMMNKIKSARLHLVKFLFIVPLLATLLLAFRDKIGSVGTASSAVAAKMVRGGTGSAGDGTEADKGGTGSPGSDTVILNGSVTIGKNLYSFRELKLAMNDSVKMGLNPAAASLMAASSAVTKVSVPTMGSTVTRMDTVPKAANSVKPLYVLDGVQMPENWATDSINPKDIQSIEVVKGDRAVRYFGPKAVNGVIVILTKNANLPAAAPSESPVSTTGITERRPMTVHILPDTDERGKMMRVTIDTSRHSGTPLYYLDGVEMSPEQMKTINPNDIESINVIKGDSAIIRYGEKGHEGVILIQMKKKGTAARDQRTMIFDDKKGERMTMRADSISWQGKKGSTKEYAFFINGHSTRDVALVEMLINRGDVQVIESTEKEEALAKLGLKGRQKMMNIVTTANKDNSAAYMLASR